MDWWLVHKCIMEFNYGVAWLWSERTGLTKSSTKRDVNEFCAANEDLCTAIWVQFLTNGRSKARRESETYRRYQREILRIYVK